jgi:hypothetical protein
LKPYHFYQLLPIAKAPLMGAFAIGLSYRGNEDVPFKKREAFFKSKDAEPSTG